MPIPGYTKTHLFDIREAIAELKPLLEPNGAIIFTTESKDVERIITNSAKANNLNITKKQLNIPQTKWEKKKLNELGKGSLSMFILKLPK